jgi:hypothetical protein
VDDALARWHLASGAPESALALIGDELAGARRHGPRKLEARALELRGRALLQLGQSDESTRSLEDALAVAREIEYPPVARRALSLLAELARREGDPTRADRQAGEKQALVASLAALLPEPALRRRFAALGDRRVSEPLAAYV